MSPPPHSASAIPVHLISLGSPFQNVALSPSPHLQAMQGPAYLSGPPSQGGGGGQKSWSLPGHSLLGCASGLSRLAPGPSSSSEWVTGSQTTLASSLAMSVNLDPCVAHCRLRMPQPQQRLGLGQCSSSLTTGPDADQACWDRNLVLDSPGWREQSQASPALAWGEHLSQPPCPGSHPEIHLTFSLSLGQLWEGL
jgi:hypothetical protein